MLTYMRYVKRILGMSLFFSFLFSPVPIVGAQENAPSNPTSTRQETAEDPATSMLRALDEVGGQRGVTKKDYKIQAGDKINLKIYPEDQFLSGGEFQVTPEGNITLSLLGKIKVAGLSLKETVNMLEQIIDKDYLVNPEVSIEVMESKQKSFVILGEVKKPGTYPFPTGDSSISFLQAISLAGGFSDIANIKKIKILRQGPDGKNTIRANAESIIGGNEPDIELQEGDVVNVDESLF